MLYFTFCFHFLYSYIEPRRALRYLMLAITLVVMWIGYGCTLKQVKGVSSSDIKLIHLHLCPLAVKCLFYSHGGTHVETGIKNLQSQMKPCCTAVWRCSTKADSSSSCISKGEVLLVHVYLPNKHPCCCHNKLRFPLPSSCQSHLELVLVAVWEQGNKHGKLNACSRRVGLW